MKNNINSVNARDALDALISTKLPCRFHLLLSTSRSGKATSMNFLHFQCAVLFVAALAHSLPSPV